jgi:hypothetical protein
MGMTMRRAAYHAYEAKLMAEESAHVNKHVDMVIANSNRHWFLSSHPTRDRKLSRGAPVSLKQLQRWIEKYGPKDTSELDKIRQ